MSNLVLINSSFEYLLKKKQNKELTINDAEFAVLDFETTGTTAQHNRVIEVGIVKVHKLKIVDSYESLINPEVPIPSFITRLTGITNLDVNDAPAFIDIARDVLDFIGDAIFVAHNLPFDQSFLNCELQRCDITKLNNQTLCTLKLARKVYPNLKSKSLPNLSKSLRIKNDSSHRALSDATATAKILIKMLKSLKKNNNITTISGITKFQNPTSQNKASGFKKKKLADAYLTLPNSPGVYFYKNSKHEIIYIGKAKSLKKRVANYFSSSADYKAKKVARKASSLEFLRTNSELSALLAETQLIKKHKPVLNTLLKKYSQQYFLKIRTDAHAPDVRVTSIFDFDGCDYFGPYNNRDTASTLKEIIDSTFLLRECNDKEIVKKRSCYLFDIKRCLAPCTKNNSEDYSQEVLNVYDFLSNKNQHAINRLLEKMKSFSQEHKYEEAALIRDTINLILNQTNKSAILAEPVNTSKCLIEILSSPCDYILLLDGKVYLKDDVVNQSNFFNDALDEYYSGSISLLHEIDKKDLDLIKISLAWLVKHRTKVNIYYLNDFKSKEELFRHIKI